MRRYLFALWLVPLWVLSGCTSTTSNFGQIAGNVLDVNANPVRDALVSAGGATTRSNSAGIFLLDGVREGEVTVRAEIVQDGARFTGQNVVRVFPGDRTKNTNIVVVRTDQQAVLRGSVSNRFGNRIQGARVFALLPGGLSGAGAITNANGEYRIEGLQAGVDYYVQASANRHTSDDAFVNLSPGQTRTLNFTLSEAGDPLLSPPNMVDAISWTTPAVRSEHAGAYEAIKNLIRPERTSRRRAAATDRSVPGSFVEVDLYFDFVDSLNLLGYGVYRSPSPTGPFTAIDFIRDPLAEFYADMSDNLRVGNVYHYRMTSLNTRYPDTSNGESNPSNIVSQEILGPLNLRIPMMGPTFRWDAAQGARWYRVFVFDRFPGIGVNSLWASEASNATTALYDGPALQFGRTYWYVVLGFNDDGGGLTLSELDSFVHEG